MVGGRGHSVEVSRKGNYMVGGRGHSVEVSRKGNYMVGGRGHSVEVSRKGNYMVGGRGILSRCPERETIDLLKWTFKNQAALG